VCSKRAFSSLYASALLLLAAGILAGADPFNDEQYAVYSAVLANIQFSHADHNKTLVIVRDTLDSRTLPIPTKDCRTLPAEARRRMEDILASRREPSAFASRTLGEKKFAIGRAYVLVSPQTAEQWQHERFSPRIATDPPGEEIVLVQR
jgi:hypothetical protein